jgi:ATP-dependent DNA helicase RecG
LNEKEIQNIIDKGEGLKVEFKKATNKLPKNLFETVCAFLNREGGSIVLGVDDDKHVIHFAKILPV